MGELALNLGLLALSLVLAILGAIIGAWFQQRSWRNQHWEELRLQRIAAASRTAQDLSKFIDRRLYRQRRVIWAVRKGGSEQAAAIEDYREAIFEWMDNLGRMKAELWQSFGRYTAIDFEDRIHDQFALVGRNIEAQIRKGRVNSLAQEEAALNRLGRTSYEFVHNLLSMISSEDLVGLRGRDIVSFENWDNLSTGFLIKRLFGIPV